MATAIAVGTVIGKGLLASALGDLYLFIKASTYNEELEQILRNLDIKAELDVVQALLSDLANHIECRTVKVSSDQVRESVHLIRDEMEKIHNELEYHKTRYFSNWRSPDYQKSIQRLKGHRDILRKRRELLLSVLGVQNTFRGQVVVQRPLPAPPTPHAPQLTVNNDSEEPKRKSRVKSFFEKLLEHSSFDTDADALAMTM